VLLLLLATADRAGEEGFLPCRKADSAFLQEKAGEYVMSYSQQNKQRTKKRTQGHYIILPVF
jgi:hypothetical protein